MSRRQLILFVSCISVILIAGVGYGIYSHRSQEKENKILSTDAGYAEEEITHADSAIVGKWRNAENPGWYKVYYDDFDEDAHMFWGKEWNEAEDVVEEDLIYHGNGWFHWEKKDGELHEYATMDMRDMPIHNGYILLLSTPDSLVYCQQGHRHLTSHFSRVN